MDDSASIGVSLKELSAAEYSRFSALLDQSIELAPAQRLEWLATLDRTDPKLAVIFGKLLAL